MKPDRKAQASAAPAWNVPVRRVANNARERITRVPWPPGAPSPASSPRVAVVSVNYNSLEHSAHLLFSLFRVLETAFLRRIVVVDNRSQDGSASYLEVLAERGLIDLVRNPGPPYHGPGLNRGLSHLARLQRRGSEPIDYVWVLDSDVIVLRPDALEVAVETMRASGAALAGQLQHDIPTMLPEGYAHISANLIDPRRVWRRGVPPFLEHGAPGASMQRSLRRRGVAVLDFPFYASGYLLHLGRGTLGAIAKRGDRRNRYYGWAVSMANNPPEGDPDAHHFHGNPEGRRLLERFIERFEAEVPALAPGALAAACERPGRIDV